MVSAAHINKGDKMAVQMTKLIEKIAAEHEVGSKM
jgi:hypothetical protein